MEKKRKTTTEKTRECEPLRLIEDFPLARHRASKKAAAECGIIKHLQIPSSLPITASATALSVASADSTLKTSPFITAARDPAETAGACCLSTGHLIFSKHLLNPLSHSQGTMGARPRPRQPPARGSCCHPGPAWPWVSERCCRLRWCQPGKRSLGTRQRGEITAKCFLAGAEGTRSFSSSRQAIKCTTGNPNQARIGAAPL